MHVETTGRRIPAVYLWGAFFVLAWAVLTALIGGGDARADDESRAPLSGLASLVDDAVGEVVAPVVKATAATVEELTAPVVKTVEKAVSETTTAVASVPVVGEPVAETVVKTAETTSNVTETVETVASSAPVTVVIAPVTDIVRAVPVVGAVVEDLGATGLVDETASSVDEILEVAAPTVESTVAPVVDALQPGIPDAEAPDSSIVDGTLTPIDVPADADPSSDTTAHAETAATVDERPSYAASGSVTRAAMTLVHEVATDKPMPSHQPGSAPEPALSTVTSTSAAGNGGPSPGAHADGPANADLIGAMSSRTAIPANALLPPSSADSTDVSPD
ncbi:hypothetical protein AB0N64_10005 [Microbacterium sp. NPDC089318]